MGGDDAPGPEVAGAVAAVREDGARVILLGDEPRLRGQLARLRALGGDVPDIPIRHCSESITMTDHPGQAVRKKRDSSMRVAFELVKRGEAQAVVSAGNSGAMLACGLLFLGRIPGVERPGIVVNFPTLRPGHQCALIDTGANVDCKPVQLLQFAVLGATFASLSWPALPARRPRVGLLSNGEESIKGTELSREAHSLLGRDTPRDFDYVGYVEGRDLFAGATDVVVSDGFTGNVALKTAEGTAHLLVETFKRAVRGSLRARLGAYLMRPMLRGLSRLFDVERRGGAVLLGVAGVVILCHGRAGERAVHSAILLARQQAEAGVQPALSAAIARHRPLWMPNTDTNIDPPAAGEVREGEAKT